MEETFGALLKQLPRDTEVPGLIDDISAAALNAGLSLNVMDPQRITQTQFYNELPLNIEVVGGFITNWRLLFQPWRPCLVL